MPPDNRPNPSFFAVDIPSRDDVAEVEQAIGRHIDDEEGGCLTWIGGNRYALSRSAGKRLLPSGGPDAATAMLRRIDGVRDARRMRANDMVRAYSERIPVETPSGAQPNPETRWNLMMVRAPEAWDLFAGGLAGAGWSRVRLGHLDTGYTHHEALGFGPDNRSPFVKAHGSRTISVRS